MQKWEQVEKDRYNWLYANCNYCVSHIPRKDNNISALRLPLRHKVPLKAAMLDIGCGHADINMLYKNYVGCDIAEWVIEKNKHDEELGGEFHVASISQMPDILKDRHFDVSVCADVLEHIPPEQVQETLRSISFINSDWYILSICCRDSVIKGQNGETLHPTIERPEVWDEWVRVHFHVAQSWLMRRTDRYKAICYPKYQ